MWKALDGGVAVNLGSSSLKYQTYDCVLPMICSTPVKVDRLILMLIMTTMIISFVRTCVGEYSS